VAAARGARSYISSHATMIIFFSSRRETRASL
jgi:hypothetical protein